jgi:hypothetical protein
LLNLRAYYSEKLVDEYATDSKVFLPYDKWMEVTYSDLMRYAMKQKQAKDRMAPRWNAENRVPSIISSYHVSEPMSGESVLSGRDHEKVENEDNQDNHDGNHGGNDNGHEYKDAQHIIVDSGANGGLLNTLTESKSISKNSCLKGILRDDNAYKDFKEDRYYDSWIKSVKANVKLHGVSQVLDKDYKLLSEEAISEFEDMQTYMWAIVVNTVKTATGKQLIRQHDGGAQLVFAKHHQELKESQKAEFSADDLHDKIKDLVIDKWTGTCFYS